MPEVSTKVSKITTISFTLKDILDWLVEKGLIENGSTLERLNDKKCSTCRRNGHHSCEEDEDDDEIDEYLEDEEDEDVKDSEDEEEEEEPGICFIGVGEQEIWDIDEELEFYFNIEEPIGIEPNKGRRLST